MRYLRLYRAFLINCLSRTMEFRAQFFAGILGYAIWTGVALIFIQAVFGNVSAVRGWTRDEMWVLYGTFVILESFCYGILGPNMWRFSGMVRDGGLDLVLTKPVSAQFFVSARYLDLNGWLNSLLGFVLVVVGLMRVERTPSLAEWALWAALLTCAFILAYAVWFGFVILAVWAVKLEAIAVIFDPMMQLARFPIQIYPQRLVTFLTIGIPVAFLTTYPSQALLGKANLTMLAAAIALSATLLWVSNRFFLFALRYYGSASS